MNKTRIPLSNPTCPEIPDKLKNQTLQIMSTENQTAPKPASHPARPHPTVSKLLVEMAAMPDSLRDALHEFEDRLLKLHSHPADNFLAEILEARATTLAGELLADAKALTAEEGHPWEAPAMLKTAGRNLSIALKVQEYLEAAEDGSTVEFTVDNETTAGSIASVYSLMRTWRDDGEFTFSADPAVDAELWLSVIGSLYYAVLNPVGATLSMLKDRAESEGRTIGKCEVTNLNQED